MEKKIEIDKDYFLKQWVDGIFNQWCVYHSPTGFSSGNTPVESYNAVIKKNFTMRFKFNLLPCLEMFKEVVETYEPKQFLRYRKATTGVKKLATYLIDKERNSLKVVEKTCHYTFYYMTNLPFL